MLQLQKRIISSKKNLMKKKTVFIQDFSTESETLRAKYNHTKIIRKIVFVIPHFYEFYE